MREEQLARQLSRGLGRAVAFVREHDAVPYREVIAHACVHNTAYDPQVEGSRAPYMLDVIRAADEGAFYRERILTALATVTSYWDACQLFDFAWLFALDGDADARAAMYRKFDEDDAEQRFTGAEAIVALDGLAGFLAVARRIGAAVRADPTTTADDYLLRLARDRCGAAEVDRALAGALRNDPDIAAYLAAVDALAARRAAYKGTLEREIPSTYEAVAARIAERGRRAWSAPLRTWSERASDLDLARAAADLARQQDPDRALAYLRLFQRRPFPLDPELLLDLAGHPDAAVAFAAMAALRQVSDPRVRATTLAILDDARADGARKGQALGLLARGLAAGDDERVAALLDAADPADADDYHALGAGALTLLEAHPSPAATGALVTLYEAGPCSHCRERCVDLLHLLGRLPGDILDECRFDANLDLRVKAERYRAEGARRAAGDSP